VINEVLPDEVVVESKRHKVQQHPQSEVGLLALLIEKLLPQSKSSISSLVNCLIPACDVFIDDVGPALVGTIGIIGGGKYWLT